MGKETRLLTLAAIGLCVLAAIIVLTSKKKTDTPPLATTTESMYDNTTSNTTTTTSPTTSDVSQSTTDNNKIASAYKTLDQNGVLKEEVTPAAPATRKIVTPQATPRVNTVVPNDVATVTSKKSDEFTEKGNTKKVAPSVKPKAIAQTGFVIIGGAFSDLDNAKTELARLKKMGFGKASISKQESNGYEMISLAHFNDEAAARDYVARCKKKGVSAYVKKMG
jgi:cell division septation protein DedD